MTEHVESGIIVHACENLVNYSYLFSRNHSLPGVATADDREFRYKAPDATSVELMCEFNGWKGVPMTKGDDGVWTTKVRLSPGTCGYKFLVNGKDWVLDPDNSNKKTVDGIENSSIEIK